MRKIDIIIKQEEEKYKEIKERLQHLYELRDASDFEGGVVKPNFQNVLYYGAYYKGVRDTLNMIRDDHYSLSSLNKMQRDALLKLATQSIIDADRWMGGTYMIRFRPVERDKKGKPKRYEAYWAEEVKIIRNIE